MKNRITFLLSILLGVILLISTTAATGPAPRFQTDNPNPPDTVVKLIFIHHSTGENWLKDDYGIPREDVRPEQLLRQ